MEEIQCRRDKKTNRQRKNIFFQDDHFSLAANVPEDDLSHINTYKVHRFHLLTSTIINCLAFCYSTIASTKRRGRRIKSAEIN
jgi:hypothetical protein